MNSIKEAVMMRIWKGLCFKWFALKNNDPLSVFLSVSSNDMHLFFQMKFDNGKKYDVCLHEQNVYASFYSRYLLNPDIYSIAKAPSCELPDIVLAKGGPDAIAESFYNSMKAQQQSGSQSNKNLARTKINWCLPSLKLCDGIIQESVQTYSQNNDKIKGHRRHTSVSSKASNYSVSKVMNHIDSESGCCPFLADGDFLHSESNDS